MALSEERIRQYHAEERSLGWIAKKHSVTVAAVSYWFKKLGLKPHNKPRTSNRVEHRFAVMPDTIKRVNQIHRKTGKLKGEIVDEAVRQYARKER